MSLRKQKSSPSNPSLFAAVCAVLSTLLPFSADASSRTSAPTVNQEPKENGTETYYPQADAFKAAHEASAYLGTYMLHYGPYGSMRGEAGKELRRRTQESINICLKGSSECTDERKVEVMNALVQYNLGKDLRRMMLENATNHENIKSMKGSQPIAGLKGRGSIPEPFKLNEKDVGAATTFLLDSGKVKEREILGPSFLNEYRSFLNEYSHTTPEREEWHYVAQKVPGEEMWVFARGADGKPMVDAERFTNDQLSQRHKSVQEAAQFVQKSITEPKLKKVASDTYRAESDINENLMTDKLGLIMPLVKDKETGKVLDEQQSAVAYVRIINSAVDEAKKRAQVPKDGSKVVAGYSIDPDKFRDFLDEIWPPSVGKIRN